MYVTKYNSPQEVSVTWHPHIHLTWFLLASWVQLQPDGCPKPTSLVIYYSKTKSVVAAVRMDDEWAALGTQLKLEFLHRRPAPQPNSLVSFVKGPLRRMQQDPLAEMKYSIHEYDFFVQKGRRKMKKEKERQDKRKQWHQCLLVLSLKCGNPDFTKWRIVLIVYHAKNKGMCM